MAERNSFIDFIKGIAIILVLFNHYEWAEGSFVGTHLYNFLVCMAVPIFMLCTGFVSAASFSDKNVSLKDAYNKKVLATKISRYTFPVLWFYLAETVLTFAFQHLGYLEYLAGLDFEYNHGYGGKKMTLLGTIIFFFAGGRGQHGTYYFPIILQVAFMIPVIYHVVKKYKYGVHLCFAITVALEGVKIPIIKLLSEFGVSNSVCYGIYRLVAFRYIFVLALGCYIYLYRDKFCKWYKLVPMFVIGILYIWLIEYTSYERVIFVWWQNTSAIAVLYIAPIFALGVKYLGKIKLRPVEELGKASYHILMVQIIYYNFFAPLVWTAPKSVIPCDAVGFLIGLAICLGGGYGYYKLYCTLSRKLRNRGIK